MTQISRRFVRANGGATSPPHAPDLHVAIDDRWDHVASCLAVAHDGFVEAGFMTPAESGLRVIPEYRNPGTLFLVCFDGPTPVGSTVVVVDGPFGLPADRAFPGEMAEMRQQSRVVEAGSLAVARSHRRYVRPIVQRLFIAAYIAAGRSPTDTIVISGNPSHLRFWTKALNFALLGSVDMHFGAPAICLAVPIERYGDAFLDPATPHQRAMADLFDERGRWLYDAKAPVDAAEWPGEVRLADAAVSAG